MDKTLERVEEADLFLVVIDGSQRPVVIPQELVKIAASEKTIIALNKNDLSNFIGEDVLLQNATVVAISALTGDGLDELSRQIESRADAYQTEVGDEIIAINARHTLALQQARDCLAQAVAKLSDVGAIELLASDLRGVLAAYGEISGKVDNERMLDALFATFCIGK
jgi:tRNA modification GTPase